MLTPQRLLAILLTCTLCFSICLASFAQESYTIPYKLNEPHKKYKLPEKLDEISGICSFTDSLLACVQDESGNIYIFNLLNGKITDKVDFGKSGDYEDIALVGNNAIVIRSDGVLFEVVNWLSESSTIKHINFLEEENDVEGLCYDHINERLLLACKGHPANKQENKGNKAIYSYDLQKSTLNRDPAYLISILEIQEFLKTNWLLRSYEWISGIFSNSEGSITYQPSAIGIHPIDGYIYTLASVGKLLIIIDPADGKIIGLESLDSNIFKQPEGITFMSNGDMLISNEAKNGKANIIIFNYIQN